MFDTIDLTGKTYMQTVYESLYRRELNRVSDEELRAHISRWEKKSTLEKVLTCLNPFAMPGVLAEVAKDILAERAATSQKTQGLA
jgi:hypothetical protein